MPIQEEEEEEDQEMEVEQEMEIENHHHHQQQAKPPTSNNISSSLKNPLVVFNFLAMAVSLVAVRLLYRHYFVHGGRLKWMLSWTMSGGTPLVVAPPLSVSYFFRRRRGARGSAPRSIVAAPRLLAMSVALGLLQGCTNIFYTYGFSYLPLSTGGLVLSSQLVFTCLFAFVLVKQKFTPYVVNAVVLLTASVFALGMPGGDGGGGGDRSAGESRLEYYGGGFGMTVAAMAIFALVITLTELMYARTKVAVTYALLIEMQLVRGLASAALSTVGMWIFGEFQAIRADAKGFDIGVAKYCMVVGFSTVLSPIFFLCNLGSIFYSSALLVGIVQAALIPVTEALAVVLLREKFTGEKAMALVLSLWGFVSYFYEKLEQQKKAAENTNANAATVAREV